MTSIGKLLLYAGFLVAAFASVQQADEPELKWQAVTWSLYAIGATVGFAGVVVLRISATQVGTHSHKIDADMQTIDNTLNLLVEKIESLNKNRDDIGVYGIHPHIDDHIVEDLGAFVEVRESIAHRYGLQRYADLMSQFALAERNLNRAWSASADGYIDETWLCLDNARNLMKDAQQLFHQYRHTETAQ